jgi:hypothetical protein
LKPILAANDGEAAVLAVVILILVIAAVFALSVAFVLLGGNERLYPGRVVQGKVKR